MSGHVFRPFGGGSLGLAGAVETGADASCFADEVVVDFPSVAPAVERIRRAFLADERTGALRATIQLSAREAREGATVPLEVAVHCTCRGCGGRGETWTEPCRECCGTGASLLRRSVRLTLPPGILHGACVRFRLSSPHAAPVRVEVRVAVESAA